MLLKVSKQSMKKNVYSILSSVTNIYSTNKSVLLCVLPCAHLLAQLFSKLHIHWEKSTKFLSINKFYPLTRTDSVYFLEWKCRLPYLFLPRPRAPIVTPTLPWWYWTAVVASRDRYTGVTTLDILPQRPASDG